MSKKIASRIFSLVLAFALVATAITVVPENVQAASAKITLNKTKQTVFVGKSATVKVKSVKGLKSKSVTFTSSNKSVATVNSKGKVVGKKKGTANITVTSKSNKKVKATCKITVRQQVTGIQTASSLVMQKGKSATLSYGITPSNASSKKVSFSSSNKKVATVSSKGKISAKNVGTAKITVKSADGFKKATVKVSVKKKITNVSKVSLNQTSMTLDKGTSGSLKASVSPSKATSKKVYWVSSNTSVATVSTSGKVVAKADGTTKITAYATDSSGKKATCTVKVVTPVPPTPPTPPTPPVPPTPTPDPTVNVESVSVNLQSVKLKTGETAAVVATVAPANATNKTVTWTSNNTGIATVNDGTITAVAEGKATITVTSNNGKTASVEVEVNDNLLSVVGTNYVLALSNNKNYTVTNGTKTRTINSADMNKAYNAFKNNIDVNDVTAVFNKITEENCQNAINLISGNAKITKFTFENGVKTIEAQANGDFVKANIKVQDNALITTVESNRTASYTVTVRNIKERSADIEVVGQSIAKQSLKASWSETSFTLELNNSTVAEANFENGTYTFKANTQFVADVLSKITTGTTMTDIVVKETK